MSKKKKAHRSGAGLPTWDLPHLHAHLQYAVDLELWTIPFYMSALYSIKDPSSDAYQLVQSVTYQEMLHVELVSNIANAFGLSPTFKAPVYRGKEIPHLDFQLDEPNPTTEFHPYSAELGPLDEKRLNAMCLIEYPEWHTGGSPNLRDDVTEYGSIAEFYQALIVGVSELAEHIRGGRRQVDLFKRFYNDFAHPTITRDGRDGLPQVLDLIEAVTEQGEGQAQGHTKIPHDYRNTADDIEPAHSHFKKFASIRDQLRRPEIYTGVADPPPHSQGHLAQQILIANFTVLRHALESLFSGGALGDFGSKMAVTGGNVLNCWKNQAIPRFS